MGRAHVRVRPAEVADVPAIAELAAAEGVVLLPGGTRQMQADALAQLPERLAEILQDPSRHMLVAVTEDTAPDEEVGRVVGMALLCQDRMNDFVPTTVVRLGGLTVDPAYRRKGAGRALLAAVVHLAEEQSVEYVVVPAASRSRDANRYLARLGFVPMISRRVASVPVLRRSLGLGEASDRMAQRRRALIARNPRTAVAARTLRRGA